MAEASHLVLGLLQPKLSCKSTLWLLTKHSQYKHSTYFALSDFVFSWFRIATTKKNSEIKWSTKISFTLNSTDMHQSPRYVVNRLWYAICDSLFLCFIVELWNTDSLAHAHTILWDKHALVCLSFVYHRGRCFCIVWILTHILPVTVFDSSYSQYVVLYLSIGMVWAGCRQRSTVRDQAWRVKGQSHQVSQHPGCYCREQPCWLPVQTAHPLQEGQG